MGATTEPATDARTTKAVDRNLEQVPKGAPTILLPNDDPDCFEHYVQSVINSLSPGANVYARHLTRDGRPK